MSQLHIFPPYSSKIHFNIIFHLCLCLSSGLSPSCLPTKIFSRISLISKSCDSSVGIALGYRLDDRGSRVRFPAGAGNFSLHHRDQNGSGATLLPIQWVPLFLFLGVKRQGREADHSSPCSAEVKECVGLYLHSPVRLHGVVLS
jgi:hypothetical protein